VKSLQTTLGRVLKKKITPTGVFTTSLANHVKTYQRRAQIKASGRVGPQTWTSLMVTVARLSADTASVTTPAVQNIDNTILFRKGSRGTQVRNIQRQLNIALAGRRRIGVDGVYGSVTANAVKVFQKSVGLRVTGKTTQATWDALFVTPQVTSSSTDTVLLRKGSRGDKVRNVQRQLNIALAGQRRIRVDGDYGSITANAVKMFQRSQGLRATGVTTQATWDALFG
jgi:peptidoglycan hydrolase-like protein with peptidoglycan-binding domain